MAPYPPAFKALPVSTGLMHTSPEKRIRPYDLIVMVLPLLDPDTRAKMEVEIATKPNYLQHRKATRRRSGRGGHCTSFCKLSPSPLRNSHSPGDESSDASSGIFESISEREEDATENHAGTTSSGVDYMDISAGNTIPSARWQSCSSCGSSGGSGGSAETSTGGSKSSVTGSSRIGSDQSPKHGRRQNGHFIWLSFADPATEECYLNANFEASYPTTMAALAFVCILEVGTIYIDPGMARVFLMAIASALILCTTRAYLQRSQKLTRSRRRKIFSWAWVIVGTFNLIVFVFVQQKYGLLSEIRTDAYACTCLIWAVVKTYERLSGIEHQHQIYTLVAIVLTFCITPSWTRLGYVVEIIFTTSALLVGTLLGITIDRMFRWQHLCNGMRQEQLLESIDGWLRQSDKKWR